MINITYCDKCIFVALEEFSLVPGRFGHHALRYYGRGGRCCPCTGLASRRVTPSARTSQEAWPGAESGGQSPGESRSGAPEGERAPQAEALRKQRLLWRASAPNANKRRALRPLVCTADNGWIASFGAPLPSLFFARAAEFLNWLGGGKARTRSRRENAFYFLPANAGADEDGAERTVRLWARLFLNPPAAGKKESERSTEQGP